MTEDGEVGGEEERGTFSRKVRAGQEKGKVRVNRNTSLNVYRFCS